MLDAANRLSPVGSFADYRKRLIAVCEAAICYTGDILDPTRTKYSLDYYVRMAKRLVKMGTHVLAIKDMAGLFRAGICPFVILLALPGCAWSAGNRVACNPSSAETHE